MFLILKYSISVTLNSNPYQSIPAKCCICKALYLESYFKSNLNSDQLNKYEKYLKMKRLRSDQKMVNCYYCESYQVWAAKPKTNFFYCENSACGKAFCTLCNQLVDNDRDERDTEQEQIEYEEEEHPICFEYKDMRNEWDMILQKGAMRFCPNPSCKTGGIKDTDCTHMKCFTCGTNYCYFCGKAEANCNKSKSEPGLARHNDNWNTNSNRCPIFLLQIQEIDQRWKTEDDDVCLALFHKLLTYGYIREFINKHSRDTFDTLCDAFDLLKESGLDINDILSADLTMIKRK